MHTRVEDGGLRGLLEVEAAKERRGQQRVRTSIGIAALVGFCWILISVVSVVLLERESARLTSQIGSQEQRLEGLAIENATASEEYKRTTKDLDKAKEALSQTQRDLESIVSAKKNAQTAAEQALAVVTSANAQISKNDGRLGFFSPPQAGVVIYRGKDGEEINFRVHYNGQESRVTYSLGGVEKKLSEDTFSFVLDKRQSNPLKLEMKFGFDSRGGSYNLTITTSEGRGLDTPVKPSGWFSDITFVFYIL